jgi:4-hydroxy-tetrahydrodipicolinate synthase
LDEAAFRRHLLALLPEVDGVVVLGSSGQLALLLPEVASSVVAVALEVCAGHVPVYVGVGDTSTPRVLANLGRYPLRGTAGVLTCGPYFQQVLDEGALEEHFLAVAAAAPVPLILYNLPSAVGYSLSSGLVSRLATDPRVIGIKDSSGDLFLFQEYLRAAQGDSFTVLQGREQLLVASIWLGAAGTVSALANIAPRLLREAIGVTQGGDRERAVLLQHAVTELATLFDHGHWISALMAALAELGIGSGEVSPPLPKLARADRLEIRRLLSGASREKLLLTLAEESSHA